MKGSSFRRSGRTLTLWPSYSVSVPLTPVPAEGNTPPANGVVSTTASVADGIGMASVPGGSAPCRIARHARQMEVPPASGVAYRKVVHAPKKAGVLGLLRLPGRPLQHDHTRSPQPLRRLLDLKCGKVFI